MNTLLERVELIGFGHRTQQHPTGSSDWLEQRRHAITGSDIAPILDLSPYESAWTLWHKKKGYLPETEQNEAMRTGQIFEPAIHQAFCEKYSELTVQQNVGTWVRNDNPRHLANPDAIAENAAGDACVVEYKFSSRYWKELPVHYAMQVMWYQYVTGLKNDAYVYALTGGHLRAFEVRYSEVLMEGILKSVNAFCDLLDTNTTPTVTAHNATYEGLRETYKLDEEKEHQISPELWAKFENSEDKLQFFDTVNTLHKSEIMQEAQGAKYLYNPFGELVFVMQQPTGKKPYLKRERN